MADAEGHQQDDGVELPDERDVGTRRDANELEAALTALARTVRGPRLFEWLCRRAGLPVAPQLLLLFARVAECQPVRMASLAEMMGVDRSTISRQVGELVQAGYATRERDPNDGRALFVRLTRAGDRAQSEVEAAWRSLLGDATRDWAPRERLHAVRLLAGLSTSLERAISTRSGVPPASPEPDLPGGPQPRFQTGL